VSGLRVIRGHRFDTIHECDGQTTAWQHSLRLCMHCVA